MTLASRLSTGFTRVSHKKIVIFAEIFPSLPTMQTPPLSPSTAIATTRIRKDMHSADLILRPNEGRDEGRLYCNASGDSSYFGTLYFHTNVEYVSRVYAVVGLNILACVRASVSVSKTRTTDDVIFTIPVCSYKLQKQNRENVKNKLGISDYLQPPGTLVESL